MLVMFSRLDLVFLAILIGFRVVFRNSALRDLLGLDLLFIITSVLTSFIIRIGLPEYYIYSNAAEAMIAISVIMRIPIFYFFGLYDPTQRPIDLLKQSLLAVTLSSVILTAIMIPVAALLHFDVFHCIALRLLPDVIDNNQPLGAYWFSKTQVREERSRIQILKTSWKTWLSSAVIMVL
jgi:FlaA1/EpsC-like NDP-sugar epimerase